jgi:predicted TIM-barrel fold metal-dependent hydrolase
VIDQPHRSASRTGEASRDEARDPSAPEGIRMIDAEMPTDAVNGVRNPPAGRPYKNQRPPSDYFKTNILVDTMGFNPIGVRAAIEMCGADQVMFGSDYGPVP